ncbi:39S ribosomal protein L48, mitochondrial-like [Oreochromis aureus]|uniref:39S ribosomal protein L48, mitochondrial-like n=1 Tax=Oreochromis aureus TaxID=47969 RepID=UPI0019536A4E|nr:39S ribosomal protein L48, mitochondrial-like [Oreochromis aureus]
MLPTYSYALPTKSTEVMLMQEQGTKTYVDAVLKTHHRVIKVRTGLSFLVLSAQTAGAAGVMRGFKDLTANSVINFCPAEHSERRAHTEADFQARFKARPELEGLIAQMN